MSVESAPLAYLNGRFIDSSQAALPFWDRGIIQAATVTEMVRTFHGIPFRLNQHLNRLKQSLDYLGITLHESNSRLIEIVEHLTAVNRSNSHGELGIVIFATPGGVEMYAGENWTGLKPTVCVHTFPLPVQSWKMRYLQGQSLIVPSIQQIPRSILDPRLKYRSRLHWYLADREAAAKDPGAVALLQNEDGHLTETNSGNFVLVRNGCLITPKPEDTLPGISQAYVRELAAALSIPYRESDITCEQVLAADEAFTTSTSYCIFPVTRFNQRPVGSGNPGPVTKSLLRAWIDAVGYDFTNCLAEDVTSP